ncbi:hypothetical protein TIFTF001_024713 [Ficus carica]|uniref:Thioredoxin-like fold domain-containing protein n=1 Tax=Ficus carica TaxID=3494 RepID=A0AA88AIF9_FICCA|nr:hypothetical protein TIFTF001_024713 [Ficus carica]
MSEKTILCAEEVVGSGDTGIVKPEMIHERFKDFWQVAVKLILLPMSKVSSAYDHIGCFGLFILQCMKMTLKLDERFMLIQLAVEYEENAKIVKVDTDDEYEFARDMQVRGLPTLFFISPDPNKHAIRTEGLIPIQMMRDILENEM